MNGYELQAASYKKYLEMHPETADKEGIERIIKTNEFLATCKEVDIGELYNSGAFNDITKAYCKKAMQNVGLSKKQMDAVLDEIRWLHDTVGVQEIAGGVYVQEENPKSVAIVKKTKAR